MPKHKYAEMYSDIENQSIHCYMFHTTYFFHLIMSHQMPEISIIDLTTSRAIHIISKIGVDINKSDICVHICSTI